VGLVFANASIVCLVLRVPHVDLVFRQCLLHSGVVQVNAFMRASSLFVQIYDGNTSGNRKQILRYFLLLKDYFYAIGFTWIEKVVIDLRILPRQTSPVPTLDWFYSGVTAVLSRLVS